MRNLGVGCIGAVLGLFVGLLIAFGLFQLQQNDPTLEVIPQTTSADVTVTVSGAYINSQIQQVARANGMSKETTVSLSSPNLVQVATTFDATVLGFPVQVSLKVPMRIAVQGGRLVLTVVRVDAGGVAVPRTILGTAVERIRAATEDAINRWATRDLQGTGLKIVNVQVTSTDISLDLSSQ